MMRRWGFKGSAGLVILGLASASCAQILGIDKDYHAVDDESGGVGGAQFICDDKIKNGTETGVDCGGPNCDPCADGKGCAAASDCQSHVCTNQSCHAPTCTDSVVNGAETGKDCGGPNCDPCTEGEGCMIDSDCQSQLCISGLCHTSECFEGDTKFCYTPLALDPSDKTQNVGICHGGYFVCANGVFGTSICIGEVTPQFEICNGVDDDCDGFVDNGTGACKKTTGGACASDAECASGACARGLCRLPVDAPCTDRLACASYLCVNSLCKACSVDADCSASKCVGSTCLSFLGSPCTADSDCLNGKCRAGLCRGDLGDSCSVDLQCVSQHCSIGQCTPCASPADCPTNACEDIGGILTCLLPLNAYCTDNAQCATHNCVGFPGQCK